MPETRAVLDPQNPSDATQKIFGMPGEDDARIAAAAARGTLGALAPGLAAEASESGPQAPLVRAGACILFAARRLWREQAATVCRKTQSGKSTWPRQAR